MKSEIVKEMPRIANKLDSLQDLRCSLNQLDWKKIIQFFKQYTNDETDPWYILLYIDKYCSNKDSIKFEDIAGFRVWTIKPNNKIYHRLFVADSNNIIERTQFNCEVLGSYSSKEEYFLNYELKFQNASPNKNTSIILYPDNLVVHHPDKYSHNYLLRRIEKYKKNILKSSD
jgi:hypothetical protein